MNKHESVRPSASKARQRNGGEILVAALRRNGADRMFGVPGESALPIFDALYEPDAGMRFIVCRHEATASHMAEADGKLPAVQAFALSAVDRGPCMRRSDYTLRGRIRRR